MNGQIESNTAIEAGLSATSADVLNAKRGETVRGAQARIAANPFWSEIFVRSIA
jgi:hypothetical protein